ncbi:MAG: glycosyltransferase family 2 protein [Chitinophagaceae bacterium]|nr:glycosyltransferase family 2 protein [Chitinophagaceae bacterium]
MLFWIFTFVFSCFMLLYNYVGYAIIAYIIIKIRKKKDKDINSKDTFTPTIAFIVAAFNEEDCIEEKIKNSIAQDYPINLIDFIFIADGSTDKTTEIIKQYPQIKLLFQPERKGKSAALNRAVLSTNNDILIFTDSNTILNRDATKNIIRHYADPKIGGVAGEKKVIRNSETGDQTGLSEGIYWKYESTLKKIDSEFYSVVGAAGEIFSVRKKLYENIPDSVILDDFIITLKVAHKGFRVIYEPDAFAIELPSFSLTDERKRKIRIAAGGFQAIGILRALLAFWKQPKLSFLYISHRVLRWTISPICLFLAFISNLILSLSLDGYIFKICFFFQLTFYTLALIGSIKKINTKSKIFNIAYYFVFMNICVVLGFFRFLKGKQPVTWEKAKRAQSTIRE